MTYYLWTTLIAFLCILSTPSKLDLSDNIAYSLLWAIFTGWLFWPFNMYVAVISLYRRSKAS